MKALLRVIVTLLFRVKTVNFEKLDMSGRVIIMPNHPSFLDGLFLYLLLPRDAVFVVNTQIAKRFALFLRFVRHITIDPLNPYSMRKIINVVQKEVPLVLFPEGRITTTRGLMKIYDGIGFIALKTGARIYPLIINGLEYSKFSRIKSKVRTRWLPEVSLYLDQPVQIKPEAEKPLRALKREASDKILKIMQESLFKSRYSKDTNLFNQLLMSGVQHGWSTPVIQDIRQEVSYSKLLTAVYVLSRKLRSVTAGSDNVGVMLPNSVAHVVTLFSLFYLDKTPAILNFSAGARNVADCAETADVKVVLTSREFVEKAELDQVVKALSEKCRIVCLEDVRAGIGPTDKLAGLGSFLIKRKPGVSQHNRLILFTSGSENKPKGVVLRHSNILANIWQVSSVIDFHSQDRILNALPMFHSFGLTAGTILPLLSGVPCFLYPSPLHYKIVPELVYDTNASIIFGTSTFLGGYGKHAHPYDFYSVRYVFAGAEKLKEEVRALWHEKFGIRILEGYGCTETAPVLSLNTPLCCRAGSVGRFLPGIEHRIEPVEGIIGGGKLLVRGPNVMEGYLIHGQGFIPAEEWYDCGDIVSMDEDGFICVKSRLKRFAKVSGEMVSLNLVEELAEQCFGGGRFAALNQPDAKKGEKIVLFSTNSQVSLQAFREYLAAKGYSMLLCPALIINTRDLPVLGSGKTDYLRLKEQANARMV